MVPPWWLLVAFVFGGVSAALTSSRVVRTKYGDVSGVIVTPDNRRLDAVEVFRGVPYASPPVGSLRFMPPVTGSLWSGVKVADRFGPVCPQRLPNVSDETAALKTMARGRLQYLRRLLPYLQNQSEDCLYLNIYAPAQGEAPPQPPPPLPPTVVRRILFRPNTTRNRFVPTRDISGYSCGLIRDRFKPRQRSWFGPVNIGST